MTEREQPERCVWRRSNLTGHLASCGWTALWIPTDGRCKFCGKPIEGAEMNDWQWKPMETAPKDGTRILLAWPHWSSIPVIGRWWQGEWECDAALSRDKPQPFGWMRLPTLPTQKVIDRVLVDDGVGHTAASIKMQHACVVLGKTAR